MPLELQDVDYGDGKEIANVYISAFYNDPFQKTLYPGMSFEKQVSGVISRWSRNYGDLSAHYKKVVDTDAGKVVSYSKWSFAFTECGAALKKPTGLPEDVAWEPPSTPEGLNDPFAVEYSAKMEEIREQYLGEKPQLHLKMMGTLPEYQGRGAGTLQLTWAIDLADRHGLTCWVEGSPVSVELYKKFGFEVKGKVVSQLDENSGGGSYIYTSMMREPKITLSPSLT